FGFGDGKSRDLTDVVSIDLDGQTFRPEAGSVAAAAGTHGHKAVLKILPDRLRLGLPVAAAQVVNTAFKPDLLTPLAADPALVNNGDLFPPGTVKDGVDLG